MKDTISTKNFKGGIEIKGALLQKADGVTLRVVFRASHKSHAYCRGQAVVAGKVIASTPEVRISPKMRNEIEAFLKEKYNASGFPLQW